MSTMQTKIFILIGIIATASLWHYSSLPVNIGGGDLTATGYAKEGVAFTKSNRDIKVEVGDKTKGVFIPEFKLSKWDEVSFKIKYDGSKIKAKSGLFGASKSLKTADDKIIFNDGINEVKYYELPVSEDTPEGAYEMEVLLKEKPDTNIMEFVIETAGLNFLYQGDLTQKEKDEGSFRPENVIGSYAVYASENKINYEGGKIYKTGKVGHIYRPKIIDNDGNWVWGTLNIKKGILSVDIPQEFLDKATYPVRHAAGLTFGYTTAGASTYTSINSLYTYPFTGADGILTHLSLYCTTQNIGGVNRKLIIYNGSNRVDYTDNIGTTIDAATFETIPVSLGASLSTGTYYLGYWAYSSTMLTYYDTDTSTYNFYQTGITYSISNPPPSTWTKTQSANSRKYSVYATYIDSGSSATSSTTQADFYISDED